MVQCCLALDAMRTGFMIAVSSTGSPQARGVYATTHAATYNNGVHEVPKGRNTLIADDTTEKDSITFKSQAPPAPLLPITMDELGDAAGLVLELRTLRTNAV